jgi:hypothetical protein
VNEIRLKELTPGTIYIVDTTAYYTKNLESGVVKGQESAPSNKVKIMTDIEINAFSFGTNKIKIEWDDVWNSGKRIEYKLYVSETENFANTPPIFIGQNQIGEGKPVTANEASGKLEYLHYVRDPGRVYYIRIEPDIPDTELKKTKYTKTVRASSYILVKTSKVSTTSGGTIWKLEWSPVVTGLGDNDVEIAYHIYRGVIGSNDLPQYMAAVDGTNFFVTLPLGDVKNYFVIRAIIQKNGEDVYKGIRIESEEIIVGEEEASARPRTPELVDVFERVQGDPIIRYQDELKPRSATVLWRVPKKGNDQIDGEVRYDIYLVDDPNLLDQLNESHLLAKDFKPEDEHMVLNDALNVVVGYQYKIKDLIPNSTYYFKIIAKKDYTEYIDDMLQMVTYPSDPALKVIITPTEGPIDQPNVPARPPLSVKKDEKGIDVITNSKVTIQLKNLWYEKYDETASTWSYIRSEKQNEKDNPPFNPNVTVVDNVYYRKVQYDEGVTIDVGCIEYEEDMDLNVIKNTVANKIVSHPISANDALENPKLNPDGIKHNVDIEITDLKSNSIYVIWVRASRASVNLTSGPSDPLIITTGPIVENQKEKPTVPSFQYGLPGDVYVDIGWNYEAIYNYHLKYGTVDDEKQAINALYVTAEDMKDSLYYKISDLDPNTLYYFFIQAEITDTNGNKITSQWSDSYPLKTLAYQPPDPPTGFGLKNIENAVTKNSIFVEWMTIPDLEYILEYDTDPSFLKPTKKPLGVTIEYNILELRSNQRYYLRLYAYDGEKALTSLPSSSITVRTKKSNDDYDSNENVDLPISGDIIEKEVKPVAGVWHVKIVGINADRLIELIRKDQKLHYNIDLNQVPKDTSKLNLKISDKIIKVMSDQKETLRIMLFGDNILDIRPDSLLVDNSEREGELDITYEPNIKSHAISAIETPIQNGFRVVMTQSVEGIKSPIKRTKNPLLYKVEIADKTKYEEGKTFAYLKEDLGGAFKLKTDIVKGDWNNKSYAQFESDQLGEFSLQREGQRNFDDLYFHPYEESINRLYNQYSLKSISGNLFEPDVFIKRKDAIKILLDVWKIDYGTNYMEMARKSGFLTEDLKSDAEGFCTLQEGYQDMARLYEIKSQRSVPDLVSFVEKLSLDKAIYQEMPKKPSDFITRGEFMRILEKTCIYLGELD